ncbi:DNA repair protein RecO [Aureisphaera galaxeae]|uniref:DNA repair protein RecO n=1 Tax=Aureisphaera galaxeae TaxID=1538023 RepID=UPI00235094EC|nr:DNA repair protein RecO [Aureisphaera galaxeae]MDC8005377.1 DNA repair protein RecO [Aureisphaera galaxeae]
MQVSTRALVFSSVKYAEADLIVSCFTEDYGLKSYLLRGIMKSKKGKLRASLFQPLTQLHLEAIHKDKGTLERIKEAKVLVPYTTLHTQVVKSSVVLFLAEMLKNSIQEEEANGDLFEYISVSLQWLDAHEAIANFHILFLLKLTAYLGIYPDTSGMEYPYFNLLEGNFEKEPLGDYSESGDAVDTLKRFFGINFDDLEGTKTTKKQRFEALNLLLSYYQLHLQGYKKPKSLLVLNQLFN